MTRTQTAPTRDSATLSSNQVARRQRIVDAALELLGESDYGQIQVRDVAERATVALGTVYHYFPSKDHLFGEALVQWAATLRTGITRRPLAGQTPGARLEEVLHRSVRAFARHPQMAKLVSRFEVSEDPFATTVLEGLKSTTTEVYLDALRGMDPEIAVKTMRVAESVLDATLRGWSSGRLTTDEVYDALTEAVSLLVR
ncbi:MAG: TetR/AcrR family transcriptional regulator [Acidimicrobiales bacterium]|jgi:TetR/AcrR family transcriptional regulator, cholesterol catabolism regulator